MATVQRELIIKSRDSNNEDITTTIKNINPSSSVTNLQLKNAAMQLNDLTYNTFVSVYVVNTENITSVTE